jgi:fatty-acyl-CoA synthase
VHPEDVERSIADLEGIRAGNVIAFGVEEPGRTGARARARHEGVVVVAETKGGDPEALRELVTARVRQVLGTSPHEVVLVAPGTLPKTSSGKLQRSRCRDRYVQQDLQPV